MIARPGAKRCVRCRLHSKILEHDPEKACPARDAGWVPVFGKRSCSKKKLERDDDLKKSHHALKRDGSRAVIRGMRALAGQSVEIFKYGGNQLLPARIPSIHACRKQVE